MELTSDLHLHSKFSRAVSKDMVLPVMAEWARRKGIHLLTTGDWTHPLWFKEIRSQLEEVGDGVYEVKSQNAKVKSTSQNSKVDSGPIRKSADFLRAGSKNDDSSRQTRTVIEPRFILTVEVSSIYSQGGKTRRIHNLIFVPNFEIADKVNKELHRRGVNLMSDGRPIMGLSARELLELVLGIDERVLLIPCHAWTPWFSIYGANSGFNSIEECFGNYSKYIYAIETGLSSDPLMNWKVSDLNNRSILSFSDAHSPSKMGREATVFVENKNGISNFKFQISNLRYDDIANAIKQEEKGLLRIGHTIEFYPEEGKYHYTGHRNCHIVQTPAETVERGVLCPVCQRTLTVGVEHRVQELTTPEISNIKLQISNDESGVRWVEDPEGKRPRYVALVPLLEIVAEALEATTVSQRVKDMYLQLTKSLGTEFTILLQTPIAEIEKRAGKRVAEGVKKVRERNIVVIPGYDGVYGTVKIWNQELDGRQLMVNDDKKDESQLGLF